MTMVIPSSVCVVITVIYIMLEKKKKKPSVIFVSFVHENNNRGDSLRPITFVKHGGRVRKKVKRLTTLHVIDTCTQKGSENVWSGVLPKETTRHPSAEHSDKNCAVFSNL